MGHFAFASLCGVRTTFGRVQATDATVLIQGDAYPFLLVKPYGKGYFIYHAAFQPLIGHGGFAPGMYAYLIFRRAIEWAFASANLPVPKLSPWPYQYDAAFMIRHDMENFTNAIAAIEASAQVEYTNGAKGDYYFCTGTVRDDASTSLRNSIIAGLRSAVTNYGATIGPHNGGLKNPSNSSLGAGPVRLLALGTGRGDGRDNPLHGLCERQSLRLHLDLKLVPGRGRVAVRAPAMAAGCAPGCRLTLMPRARIPTTSRLP